MTIFVCIVAFAGLGTFADEPTMPGQTYLAILQDLEDSQVFFSKRMSLVKTEKEQREVYKYAPAYEHIYQQLIDLAKKYPNDPAAVDALTWVIATTTNGYDDHKERGRWVREAVELLTTKYLNDERVGRACLDVRKHVNPNAENLIKTVYEKTTNKAVKQRATLAWGSFQAQKSEFLSSLNGPNGKDLLEQFEKHAPLRMPYIQRIMKEDQKKVRAESETLLESVIDQFGELKCDPFFPSRNERTKNYAEIATFELRKMRNLEVGQMAPEIQGTDADGKSFKLSDYRGKVVYLSFSANWCGPCVAKYPWERELVKKYQGKPFAMLSVNADYEIKTLKESIAKGDIMWRCWWQQSPDGPLTEKWMVEGFPTEYLIDENGVIQAHELATDQVTETKIDELIQKIKPGNKIK